MCDKVIMKIGKREFSGNVQEFTGNPNNLFIICSRQLRIFGQDLATNEITPITLTMNLTIKTYRFSKMNYDPESGL